MNRMSRHVRWAALLLPLAMPAMSLAAEAVEEQPNVVKSFSESGITAITTLIIFLLLLSILTKKAWGPIAKGLKAREDKIRKDIADAEADRAKAQSLLADYNRQIADAESRVRDLLAKARVDAETLAAQIRTRGQQEAQEATERATREIEEAKKQALREVYEQAANLATSAAEKIIRRTLNPDDYRDLVNESVGHLQEMGR